MRQSQCQACGGTGHYAPTCPAPKASFVPRKRAAVTGTGRWPGGGLSPENPGPPDENGRRTVWSGANGLVKMRGGSGGADASYTAWARDRGQVGYCLRGAYSALGDAIARLRGAA